MAKYLVIGNQTLGSRELRKELEDRAGPGAVIRVVVPQTPLDHYHSKVDGHRSTVAEHQLSDALMDFSDLGCEVTGEIGDADPLTAATVIADEWEPDEVILSTFPEGVSRWLTNNVRDKLTKLVDAPVTHVVGRTFSQGRREKIRYAELRREMGLAEA